METSQFSRDTSSSSIGASLPQAVKPSWNDLSRAVWGLSQVGMSLQLLALGRRMDTLGSVVFPNHRTGPDPVLDLVLFLGAAKSSLRFG